MLGSGASRIEDRGIKHAVYRRCQLLILDNQWQIKDWKWSNTKWSVEGDGVGVGGGKPKHLNKTYPSAGLFTKTEPSRQEIGY